ncbi:MAG TPA: B-box zinc finger protein [Thermoanaerobaculia bacterium]|nr:B-box zinc finger protein [Thermoanaerobaculia bacterium]
MAGGCTSHPLRPARFRCDGCERLLCDECIREGHRLLICALCGERALSLAAEGPASVKELRAVRQDRANVSYGWPELLRYCFRGDGVWIFGFTIAIFGVFQFLLLAAIAAPPAQKLLPIALSALCMVLILWIVPPQLVRIVRTTFRGRNELPEWAPAHEISERSREIVALLLAVLVGLAPSALLLRVLGCSPSLEEPALLCQLVVLATLPLMVALSCVGFAAFAEFDSRWLVLRIDLHLRFLAAARRDASTTVGAIILGMVLALLVGALLGSVPLMVVIPYVLFTAAHSIGTLFRRHRALVDGLYAASAD